MKESLSPKNRRAVGIAFWSFFSAALALTIGWCWLLSHRDLERASLAFILCSASFAIGCLLGFIFTIFGDEQEPFGKIRNAVIALASGIAGLGLGKASEFGQLLGGVHVLSDASGAAPQFSVLLVITYFVAGFFFMYFVRKLFLNPALMKATRMMARLQISGQVSEIATRVSTRISHSLLLGRERIQEIEELEPEEAKRLREDLLDPDVNEFLSACEADALSAEEIQPENISLAARLHYYRVLLEKEGTSSRDAQEKKAIEWTQRALMRDPINPEFQIKLGDLFGMQGREGEAVAIFERLERDDESPQFIQQWLGYFLLNIDGREKDAIKASLQFHDRFPDESSGLYNASCGYAQLYEAEILRSGLSSDPTSENRLQSLRYLQEAIRIDSDVIKNAEEDASKAGSFNSLVSDPDFIRIISNSKKQAIKDKSDA